jgi:hypothetical protein
VNSFYLLVKHIEKISRSVAIGCIDMILIKASSSRYDKMLFGEKQFKPKEETL